MTEMRPTPLMMASMVSDVPLGVMSHSDHRHVLIHNPNLPLAPARSSSTYRRDRPWRSGIERSLERLGGALLAGPSLAA